MLLDALDAAEDVPRGLEQIAAGIRGMITAARSWLGSGARGGVTRRRRRGERPPAQPIGDVSEIDRARARRELERAGMHVEVDR